MNQQPKGSTPGLISHPDLENPSPSSEKCQLPLFDPSRHTLDEGDPIEDKERNYPQQPEQGYLKEQRRDEPLSPSSSESASEACDPDEDSYPEGGLKAWLVVLGSFSGMVASFGMM